MCMYVCMHVCMHICIIICMYAYIYINTGERIRYSSNKWTKWVCSNTTSVLIIGQSTCLGSSNLECVLLSELSFDKTTGQKNEVVAIAETSSSLKVSPPGEYVCIVSSCCGSNSTSSVIYSELVTVVNMKKHL